MSVESSSRLHFSLGWTGAQSDGGVSFKTPRFDGADRPSVRSTKTTSGHDGSGTHENSRLAFSSLRGHSSIKDSSLVPRRSRSTSEGDRDFSLGHSILSKVIFHSLPASFSFGLQMIVFILSFGLG